VKLLYECFKCCDLGENSLNYRVNVYVKEVRGRCAMGYRPGVYFTMERYYITDVNEGLCLHALCSMLTLLIPFIKGTFARTLGIRERVM